MLIDTVYVDLGNLACGIQTDMGNPNHYVDLSTVNRAANFFCQQLVKGASKFVPGSVPNDQKHQELHYNNGFNDPVYLAFDWGDDPTCPFLDFSSAGALDLCNERLDTIINTCTFFIAHLTAISNTTDSAHLGDTSNDNGLYYWKQGGTFFRDCITWTVQRDNFTCDSPTTDDAWRPGMPSCDVPNDCTGLLQCNYNFGKGYCMMTPAFGDQGWCSCVDYIIPCVTATASVTQTSRVVALKDAVQT